MNAYSPLEVINTKMTEDNNESMVIGREHSNRFLGVRRYCESELSRRNTPQSNEKRKNFLKKGSSFDKSLVLNILKSKFR